MASTQRDRNFNKSGHEEYFWRSSRDMNGPVGKRFVKKLVAKGNRRSHVGAIVDNQNSFN